MVAFRVMSKSNEYMREYMKKKYHSRMIEAKTYLGNKCISCGAVDNLQIDHIDWKNKKYTVSQMAYLAFETLKTELDKCQLLCETCHNKKSAADRRERKFGQPNQPHGTFWRYKRYKCRCEDCVIAYTEYNRKFKSSKPRKIAVREHGTYAMYKHGCKCALCKAANTAYVKELYKRKQADIV